MIDVQQVKFTSFTFTCLGYLDPAKCLWYSSLVKLPPGIY